MKGGYSFLELPKYCSVYTEKIFCKIDSEVLIWSKDTIFLDFFE